MFIWAARRFSLSSSLACSSSLNITDKYRLLTETLGLKENIVCCPSSDFIAVFKITFYFICCRKKRIKIGIIWVQNDSNLADSQQKMRYCHELWPGFTFIKDLLTFSCVFFIFTVWQSYQPTIIIVRKFRKYCLLLLSRFMRLQCTGGVVI